MRQEAGSQMTRITVRNNIYQHIQVLKTNRTKRNRYGEFVVEGVRNINEAVKKRMEDKVLFLWRRSTFRLGKGIACYGENKGELLFFGGIDAGTQRKRGYVRADGYCRDAGTCTGADETFGLALSGFI